MDLVKLVEVTRGDLVESSHYGVVAIVDSKGNVIASKGNIEYITFMRSAAKPLQAIPVVESGAAEYYGFTLPELAVITGSHNGEEVHQQTVLGILGKLGYKESDLLCGSPKPLHKPTALKLSLENKKTRPLHCPCSGKHCGMLALCAHGNYSLTNYYKLEHPVQQIMLEFAADFAQLPKDSVGIGIDGCGVPVFSMSVKNMALAYANLVNPQRFPLKRQKACRLLAQAMDEYPNLVAGSGRFTTILQRELKGKVIAKDGSEGVFCFGIPQKGWGVAIKIVDGGNRAVAPVVLSILDQLGILTEEEKENLQYYYQPQVKNFRGETIGEIKTIFEL